MAASPADGGTEQERRFGEGSFPRELDRVNWGAFLWPWIWAGLNDLWKAAGVTVAVTLVLTGVLVGGLALLTPHGFLSTQAGEICAAALLMVPRYAVSGVFCTRANRLAWDRAAAHPRAVERYLSPAQTPGIADYLARQRAYALGFLILGVTQECVRAFDLETLRFRLEGGGLSLLTAVCVMLVAAAALLLWNVWRAHRSGPGIDEPLSPGAS